MKRTYSSIEIGEKDNATTTPDYFQAPAVVVQVEGLLLFE